MHKKVYSLVVLFLVFMSACSTDSEPENLTPEELIQGRWVLSDAVIDGENTPITNPGLGQIELIVSADTYQYIFPEVGSNGLPTGNTDSISGTWSFNEDYTTFSLDRSAYQSEPFVWTVIDLRVGVFDTQYEERNAAGGEGSSTYEFTYRLANN